MKNFNEILDAKSSIALILTDVTAVLLILFIPALSHILPFPVYYMDPMRLVLFGAYFVNRNRWNAYALAMALPIFSMLYSGHPIPIKAVLISFELLLNMILLTVFLRKGTQVFLAVFASIFLSKMAYYFAKYIFIQFTLLSGNLFSTNLITQLLIALGLSGVFYLIMGNRINTGLC